LANQDRNTVLKQRFTTIAQELEANENTIVSELNLAQGSALNIGGYYNPNEEITEKEMRPSKTFNAILDSL